MKSANSIESILGYDIRKTPSFMRGFELDQNGLLKTQRWNNNTKSDEIVDQIIDTHAGTVTTIVKRSVNGLSKFLTNNWLAANQFTGIIDNDAVAVRSGNGGFKPAKYRHGTFQVTARKPMNDGNIMFVSEIV